jgi:hypothetical protein
MDEHELDPTSSDQDDDAGQESGEVIAARLEWFAASRVDAEGEPLNGLYARALEQRAEAGRREIAEPSDETPPPGMPPGPSGIASWTPLGPSAVMDVAFDVPVAGRVPAIVVGPGAGRVYVGAANGGVWFSDTGGLSWTPLDDWVVSPSGAGAVERDALSVGSLAVRFGTTATTDEIYVGTGEFNGSPSYFGIGVRHSAAGGASGTWTLEATNLSGQAIAAMVIDPNDPTLVMAATSAGLYRRPTSGSTANWSQVVSSSFTGPSRPVTALIAAGTGSARTFYAAFAGDRVYSSTDGTTWTAVAGLTLGDTGPTLRRIALAAGESDPTALYAYIQDGTLYRLAGSTFRSVAGVPPMPANYGWYGIALAVDPGNADIVYVSNFTVFKGTISGGPGSYNFGFNPANVGSPWLDPTYVGTGIHEDQHAIAFARNTSGSGHDPTNVWVGCDGGVFQSTMSGANGTFRPRNVGLAITQMTYLAQRADIDPVVIAGSQDNGTERFLGAPAWAEQVSARGDGGGAAVDPNNPYRVMRQYTRTSLSVSTDGGASYSAAGFPPAVAGNSDGAAFYGPIATTPGGTSPTLAAFGTGRLWVTNDWGSTWVTLPTGTNPFATSPANLTQDVIDGYPITAIAFASDRLVFAATLRTVWRYQRAGSGAWNTGWTKTDLTSGLPAARWITDIAVEDATTGSFYVTLGGGGVSHLYHYDGTNWTAAMPQSVIDVPTHAVTVDPSHPAEVYVGTDVGCWHGTKTGPTSWTWTTFSIGLPEAVILDLQIHDPSRLLRATTHGRGVWEFPLQGPVSRDPDLYLRVDYADNGRIGAGGARSAWVEGAPDPTRPPPTSGPEFRVYHWMSPDIKVRRGSLSGLPPLSSPLTFYDFAFKIGDWVDSTTNIETADVSGPNRIFIQVHNRSVRQSVAGAQVNVLLLLADASTALPTLPANYRDRINAVDTSNWVAGSQWSFADPVQPYRTLPATLDVRNPGIVEYTADFSALALPAGHDHVCAAAFVTTPTDQLTTTEPSLDTATMVDKHIAHRNLHLVTAGTRPAPHGDGEPMVGAADAVLIDFHNPEERAAAFDISFIRRGGPMELSILLPKHEHPAEDSGRLHGFTALKLGDVEDRLRERLGSWLERAGEYLEEVGERIEDGGQVIEEPQLAPEDRTRLQKLRSLDRERIFVADDSDHVALKDIKIPAGGRVSAALVLHAPADAKPGDRYWLDVVQQSGDRVLGGSSYLLAVPIAHGSEAELRETAEVSRG